MSANDDDDDDDDGGKSVAAASAAAIEADCASGLVAAAEGAARAG